MSSENLYSFSPKMIVVYGKSWCPDCRRARSVLAEQKKPYLEVDIEQDTQGRAFVKQINKGYESVPTIIFPDGSYLVEPTNEALAEKIRKSQ